MSGHDAGPRSASRFPRVALRSTGVAIHGAAIALMGLFTLPVLLVVALLWFLRIGDSLVGPCAAWVHRLASWERQRLGIDPAPAERAFALWQAPSVRADVVVAEPTVRRDLTWLLIQSVWGLVLGALTVQLLITGLHDLTYPWWWRAVAPEHQSILNGLVQAHTQTSAWWALLVGAVALTAWLFGAHRLTELQSRPSHALLVPPPGAELAARIDALASTRSAALDAHAIELRRIERALHDGTQNRIVGAAVLVGAARREVTRSPERADEILERAQDSIEDALAELRAVVRSILPPVLEDRGLHGALTALAAASPVPCQLEVDVAERCPVSVETAAYFMVSEALTNVSKHSGATQVLVEVRRVDGVLEVRVADDGDGGAAPSRGSGLSGIIRRVEAHDGTVVLSSPYGGPTEIKAVLPCAS